MQLRHIDGMLFVPISIACNGVSLDLPYALVDTGSFSTLLATDLVEKVGIFPNSDDILRIVRGIGGTESVFPRMLDYLQIGEIRLTNVEVDIGGMDYGLDINCIIGLDVLISAGAIVNLRDMQIDVQKK